MVLADKGKKIAMFQVIFFTVVMLERCDIFFDTTFGTRKVKIPTRLLSSQVTYRNKRASSFTFVDVRDAVFLLRQSSLQSKWLNKLFFS